MQPVFLLQAIFQRHSSKRQKKAGALGYLIKPVDEKQLKASIEVAVARFDERCILRDETEKLRADLSDRKYIERAKGILMDSFGLKEGGGDGKAAEA